MEASKALDGGIRVASARLLTLLTGPLRAVWWLFTNVRFAIVLLALLSVISLAGVLIPQVPFAVRGDSVAEGMWLRTQEDTFGPATDAIDAAGLFDVFHAGWFVVLMALTVASTAAYILSRLPGVWASVFRPRRRVPDRYFEVAPARFRATGAIDPGTFEAALRQQRYRVEHTAEDGASYFFGDRFAWAQFGTLLTHLAVIVFILSAVVSRMDAFESGLFLAEGASLPVFPVRHARQIQVQLLDAHGEFAPDGQALEYRSDIVIYENGEEVKRCSSTVNSPCGYAGYRFFQSAYFGYGAAIEVRDLSTGNTVYRETLALAGRAAAPHVIIRDGGGQILLDDVLILTDELDTGDVRYRGTAIDLPGDRVLTVGLREAGGERRLAVLEAGRGDDATRLLLAEGESGVSGGLTVSYAGNRAVPAAQVADLPVADAQPGEIPYLQLGNVVYGTDTASEGEAPEGGRPSGVPTLTVSGLGQRPAQLKPGQSAGAGPYEYTFLGQREFSGIDVKRDRSNYLVWTGAGLIVVGLMITFWVPRRRLWAKISTSTGGPASMALAGQAPGHIEYTVELEHLAREAGATDNSSDEDD